jgi:tungstate transport system substrate-binding protein
MRISTKLVAIIAMVVTALGVATYIAQQHLLQDQQVNIRISTTTSLYATGLLEYLAERFRAQYPNVRIEFIAVGTGAALKIAEQGNACAVFVHAPSLEKQYIDRGIITGGRIFAYNFFIVVGPTNDPADINRSQSVVEVFRKIYNAGESSKALFITRGDNSGTNVKELAIWNKTALNPKGRPWYRDCGCGMDQALVMANEIRGYTLSDTGTYLLFKRQGRLPNIDALYAKPEDPDLINIYSAYIVNSCSEAVRRYAEEFIGFVYDNQKSLLESYGVDKYGAPLFYPARERMDELRSLWNKLAGG